MLKNMRNLCRVCSGPGQHEINAPIPFYLHEMDNNEALEWPQPIWMLLQDILNVPVLPNDGLPQKMCTICISYMKHAITFRKQALACRLGLLRASHVYFKEETKQGLCDTESIPQTPVCLEDRNDNLKTVNATVNKLQTKAKLPDATKKVIQTCSNARSYFSYRQKPFVEDDITTMSIFDGENFAANPPEKLSQRDCSFCWKRFMFEETFEEHSAQCIHKRFTEFIYQCNQVLQMKQETRIAPHEFIRRMVFLLQTHQDILDKLSGDTESVASSSSNQSPEPEENSDATQLLSNLQLNLKNHSLLPAIPKSLAPVIPAKDCQFKKVTCPTCRQGFLTISHLDIHRIRCHK